MIGENDLKQGTRDKDGWRTKGKEDGPFVQGMRL